MVSTSFVTSRQTLTREVVLAATAQLGQVTQGYQARDLFSQAKHKDVIDLLQGVLFDSSCLFATFVFRSSTGHVSDTDKADLGTLYFKSCIELKLLAQAQKSFLMLLNLCLSPSNRRDFLSAICSGLRALTFMI
jgi:hypothetical protein